jgi:hypothetical protein
MVGDGNACACTTSRKYLGGFGMKVDVEVKDMVAEFSAAKSSNNSKQVRHFEA